MQLESIVKILMRRDGLSREDAQDAVNDAIEQVKNVADWMMKVRCILEGVKDSLDADDPMIEAIGDMHSDARNLEYQIDYTVGHAGE